MNPRGRRKKAWVDNIDDNQIRRTYMSRKSIMGIIAVLGAVLTFFQDKFGLAIDTTAVIAGLTAIVLYILFEAKLDIKRIGAQVGKFKDPKFWAALISAILVAVDSAFELNLPVEAIISVIAIVMSILFKADSKKV